jgi:orotate phosphoribosyltransferase
MKDYKEDFIKFLVKTNALKFGEFELKSGRIAPYFLNVGSFYTGEDIYNLSKFYAKAFLDSDLEADVIYGPAYKGIPLATNTVSILYKEFEKNIAYCFNRKEEKKHGQKDRLIGSPINKNTKLVFIDDVITAGTSIRESVELLKEFGNPKVNGILISLNRMEKNNDGVSAIENLEKELNTKVFSIVNLDEVIEVLYNKEIEGKVYIDDDKMNIIKEYRLKYGV